MNRYNIWVYNPNNPKIIYNIDKLKRDYIWYNSFIGLGGKIITFNNRNIRINGLFCIFGIKLVKNDK